MAAMATWMRVDDRYAAALSAIGLKDFRTIMQARQGTPASVHGDRDAMRLLVELAGRPRELYLKRTHGHPIAGLARDLVSGRWPRARPVREYAACRRLESLGIGAMRAIGCGQGRRWLLPHQAFVIVEAVPAETSLEKALRPRADGSSRLLVGHKRRLIRAVADVAARLHDAGLRWPDLVSKHILFRLPPEAEPEPDWDLYLIDLERVEPGRSRRTRRRDLLRLLKSMPAGALSRTDLLRFAVAYCRCEHRPRAERRRAIARWFGWADPSVRTYADC